MGFDPGWTTRRLIARRDEAARQLSLLAEFTPGSVHESWSKCGKPSCHCAREGDPGHGPRWLWVRHEKGTTVTRTVPPRRVEDVGRGVEAYRRFMDQVREIVDINAVLAERELASPARRPGAPVPGPAGEKGGSAPGRKGGTASTS